MKDSEIEEISKEPVIRKLKDQIPETGIKSSKK